MPDLNRDAPLQKRCYVILLFFTLFLLFYSLGGRSIENKDYLRYAEISREILEYQDWIVLHRNQRLYVHKPPLHFWLMALSYQVFGVNPFAARVPAALLGVVGVMGMALFAGQVFKRSRMGFFSGLLLLSTLGFYWWARRTRLDLSFAVFFSLALCSFYLGWRQQETRRKLYYYMAFWGLLGFSFLVKAQICFLALPVILLFALVGARKSWDGRFALGWFSLTSLFFLLPVSVWLIPLLRHPECSAYLDLLKRSGEHIFANRHGFFYYVPYLAVKLLPAMPLTLLGIVWFFKGKAERHEKPVLFFALLWAGICMLALQLSPTRNARYLLIIYFPCCLLAVWALKVLWTKHLASKEVLIRRLDLFFWVAAILSVVYPLSAAFYYGACWWKALLLVAGLGIAVAVGRVVEKRWLRVPGVWLCLGLVFIQLAVEVGDWTRNARVSDHFQLHQALQRSGLSVKNTGFYKCPARIVEVQAFYFQKIPWQSSTLADFAEDPECRGILMPAEVCQQEAVDRALPGFARQDMEKRCVLFYRQPTSGSGMPPNVKDPKGKDPG